MATSKTVRLVAKDTITMGTQAEPVNVAPGKAFDIDEVEGKRLITRGAAEVPPPAAEVVGGEAAKAEGAKA